MVERNRVSGGHGFAILVFSSGNSRVIGNRISDVEEGILISARSSNALVKGNAIERTRFAGIVVESCCGDEPDLPTDVHINDNTFTKVADGIILFETDRAVVRRNSVLGAGMFGDPTSLGVGIWLDGVSDSVVDHNWVLGSRGPGISVGAAPDEEPSALAPTRNVVSMNVAGSGDKDGIRVVAAAVDTTVERNTASGNGADGIHELSPSTTITRNTANRNANYGIEAVPGAIDGGGNRARGNGNPAQCIGVACN